MLTLRTSHGSLSSLCPLPLSSRQVFTKKYGKGADVWALGVILYLLISGTVPFGATATSEVRAVVKFCYKRMPAEVPLCSSSSSS